MPLRENLRQLGKTVNNLRKPGGTTTSMANAKAWNAPGGGYDKWKAGDSDREKALPIGTALKAPVKMPMGGATSSGKAMSGMAVPKSFKKGGVVKKTGMAKVHKGEVVIPKNKTKKILQSVGKELKNNPPRVLAKTKKKSGAKQAGKQRVAILLSKARAQGANVPQPSDKNDGDE